VVNLSQTLVDKLKEQVFAAEAVQQLMPMVDANMWQPEPLRMPLYQPRPLFTQDLDTGLWARQRGWRVGEPFSIPGSADLAAIVADAVKTVLPDGKSAGVSHKETKLGITINVFVPTSKPTAVDELGRACGRL